MRLLKNPGFSTLALIGALSAPTVYAQDYSITILHNNDGESQLFADGDGVGGVAKFKTLFDTTKSFYQGQGHGVVSVYAGDTFLAGAAFQASLDSGAPGSRTFYDALAISQIGYDASIIGNHEFDFGPQVLAEFIGDAQTTNTTTYLSSNLDFSSESVFNPLVSSGTLAKSKTVSVSTAAGTKTVGIIGATTENLSFISSPGAVTTSNVVNAINTEAAALKSAGADVIIVGSHLQGLATDQGIVPSLSSDIDLIIAGGGDELLASPGAASPSSVYTGAPASIADTGLAPGDSAFSAYPDTASGIPIVTTADQYAYLGRVTLNFNSDGTFAGVDDTSNPQLNDGAFAEDAAVAAAVAPVQAFVDGLAANVIGTTSVQLLHGGSNTIRSQETNLGNFVADAYVEAAEQNAAGFGVTLTPNRVIGIANGGGIRDDINAGDVSQLSVFDVARFGNFVSVVEDVTVEDLVLTLENSVSRIVDNDPGSGVDPARQGDGTGRFAQVSGFSFVYDISNDPLLVDGDGNVVQGGSRIIEVVLDDNTIIWQDGQLAIGAESILLDLILPDFSAKGGDQFLDPDYLNNAYGFTTVGITDQVALQNYIESFNGQDLATVLGGEYANPNGNGRITAIPEPGSLALLGLGGLLVARRRRDA
ncbi:MAG: 5'-nucleotidase C-terminal domain-containing protein [Phycisphaeraceae bacterium]|nr:5'-nucleotidase C-terminal domain-containing protein [Phycisphaeraceae bacterium]